MTTESIKQQQTSSNNKGGHRTRSIGNMTMIAITTALMLMFTTAVHAADFPSGALSTDDPSAVSRNTRADTARHRIRTSQSNDMDADIAFSASADTVADLIDVQISTAETKEGGIQTSFSTIQDDEAGTQQVYDVSHPGASFLAIHFETMEIDDGCQITVHEAFDDTYGTKFTSSNQRKRQWSHHIAGDHAQITVSCPHDKARNFKDSVMFEVDQYAAGYPAAQTTDATRNGASAEKTVASTSPKRGDAVPEQVSTRPTHPATDHSNDHDRALNRLRGHDRIVAPRKKIYERHTRSQIRRDLAACHTSNFEDAKCVEDDKDYPLMYEKSRAVARLLINGHRMCTGFLVGNNNMLMTNYHCISSQHDLDNTEIAFMVDDECGGTTGHSIWGIRGDILDDDELEGQHIFSKHSVSMDYAIIHLAGNPNDKYGYIDLAEGHEQEEAIYIPQHPDARSKEIAYEDSSTVDGKCHLKRHGFEYSCSTQKGSSGSPVISLASNKAIGLHYASWGACRNLGKPSRTLFDEVKDIIYLQGTPPEAAAIPTAQPTMAPTAQPTTQPTMTKQPTTRPTTRPTTAPTGAPTLTKRSKAVFQDADTIGTMPSEGSVNENGTDGVSKQSKTQYGVRR